MSDGYGPDFRRIQIQNDFEDAMKKGLNASHQFLDELLSKEQSKNLLTDLLGSAARHGPLEIVKRLATEIPPKSRQSYALRHACSVPGREDIIKFLIPLSDPEDHRSEAFTWAAERGYLEAVKLLAPVSNTRARSHAGFLMAVLNGHLEVVRFLAPLVDVQFNQSQALQIASETNHFEIFHFLYPLSNPEMALLEMNRDDARTEDEKALLKNTLLLKKNKDELYKNVSDVFDERTRLIKAKKSL